MIQKKEIFAFTEWGARMLLSQKSHFGWSGDYDTFTTTKKLDSYTVEKDTTKPDTIKITQDTETYSETTVTVYRDTDLFLNFRKICTIEIFYNIFYWIRRICALTFFIFIMALIGGQDGNLNPIPFVVYMMIFPSAFILEYIFLLIGSKITKKNRKKQN